MDTYKRMGIPRGLIAGTMIALGIAWTPWMLWPSSGLVAPLAQSAAYVGLLVLTARNPRVKVLMVRTVQRWTINPLMRAPLALGINPLGLAILETTGRVSGKPRRTPVGNGQMGADFWIIAEHGWRANYVRNIAADPRVRVRLRRGLRYRWVEGTATIRTDDDPLARQRRIIRWHPLRALNAMNVRVLGADLLTIHVEMGTPLREHVGASSARTASGSPDPDPTGTRDPDSTGTPAVRPSRRQPLAAAEAGSGAPAQPGP